ncbi:MAG: alanine racemase [Deltaproteobacteria bacterium RBG_13_52_11]|nr:MAG: alanine racemase [Deltaproteobacteria bacterium RBG_13_52_11]
MSLCSHTTKAEVDLGALAYNYHQLRQLAPPSVKFLAVVKADAYGHGAIPVSKKMEELSADFLGVASLKEGVELRNGGIKKPILVLSGVYQEEVEEVLDYQLTPMVYRLEIAEALSVAANKRGKKIPIHIKVDTGMGRIGVFFEEAPAFVNRVRRFENLEIEGIASHLSTADEGNSSFAEEQLKRFSRTIEEMKKLDIDPPFCHIANSAALVNLPAAHFTLVRPGIMLYGSYPSPSLKDKVSLRQVMSWESRIADLKKVPAGYPISYGRTFVTQRPSLIAAIPVGYADGYNRLLSNRGEVLIKGKRAPVVGRVCMDWTMVDVTAISGAEVGDEVVLMGSQLGQEITPEEMGGWIGTISYEILCAVGKRVQRIYKG